MTKKAACEVTCFFDPMKTDGEGADGGNNGSARIYDMVRDMQLTGSRSRFAKDSHKKSHRDLNHQAQQQQQELPPTPTWAARHPPRLQTAADLPARLVARLSDDEARHLQRTSDSNAKRRSMLHVIRDVYDHVSYRQRDKKQLRKILHEIYQRLLDPNGLHHGGGGRAIDFDINSPSMIAERENFLRLGGAESLLQVVNMIRHEETHFQQHLGRDFEARFSRISTHGGDHTQRPVRPFANVLFPSAWELLTPRGGADGRNCSLEEILSKSRHDAASRKSILNDAMVRNVPLCFVFVDVCVLTATTASHA